MSDTGTTQGFGQDVRNKNIPQTPLESRSLLALTAAIKVARAGEADKEFIAASLEVKTLADIK